MPLRGSQGPNENHRVRVLELEGVTERILSNLWALAHSVPTVLTLPPEPSPRVINHHTVQESVMPARAGPKRKSPLAEGFARICLRVKEGRVGAGRRLDRPRDTRICEPGKKAHP